MKVACPVCGSEIDRSTDYLEHTLMSSSESCGKCGYIAEYDTGSSYEKIGDWEDRHGWSEATPRSRRDNARPVALLIARYRAGVLSVSESGFGSALAADPTDYTTAKVYADWIEENTTGREWEAFRLREYNEPWGFQNEMR